MDVERVDFEAVAREEVAVLHRAPTLVGALKLLRVREVMNAAGMKEGSLINELDEGKAALPARAVGYWEQVFPSCGCVPPLPVPAVPLVFSSYVHTPPTEGLKGAYTSSYTPANERLTKEQLKQKYRDGIAATRTGEVRVTTTGW